MKLLVLIKPEIVAHKVLKQMVINELQKNGVEIEEMKQMKVDHELAEKLYKQHKGKFFYNRLIRHISSGDVIAMRVNGNARQIIGSSKLLPRFEPENQTIRQKLAISDVRNVAHSSGDEEEAENELQLFSLL